jgi:hypothetical protein
LLDRDRRYNRENGNFMNTSATIRSYAICMGRQFSNELSSLATQTRSELCSFACFSSISITFLSVLDMYVV